MTKRKKILLCVLVCVSLLTSSLSVFAIDNRYVYNDFSGYIYTAIPNTYTQKIPDKEFSLIGVFSDVPVSKLEAFLVTILRAGGYDFPSGNKAEVLLDNFRTSYAPYSRKFQFQNDAINNFLSSSLYYVDSSSSQGLYPVCRFSRNFLQYIRFLVELFYDSNNLDLSGFDFSVFPAYTSDTDWVNDTSSISFFFRTNPDMDRLDAFGIYFRPVSSQIEESAGTGLNGFFNNFVNFIDIHSFTSWLPPVISGPVIASWSVFLGLAGLLVTLKILHG